MGCEVKSRSLPIVVVTIDRLDLLHGEIINPSGVNKQYE